MPRRGRARGPGGAVGRPFRGHRQVVAEAQRRRARRVGGGEAQPPRPRLGTQPPDRDAGVRCGERQRRDQPDQPVRGHEALHRGVVGAAQRAERGREAGGSALLQQRRRPGPVRRAEPRLAGELGEVDLVVLGRAGAPPAGRAGRARARGRRRARPRRRPARVVVERPRRRRGARPRAVAASASRGSASTSSSAISGWASANVRAASATIVADRGRERGHAQAPGGRDGQGVERAPRLRELEQRRVGVADEQLAGVGQARAARAALDQPHARLALEQRDLLRHGRRACSRAPTPPR